MNMSNIIIESFVDAHPRPSAVTKSDDALLSARCVADRRASSHWQHFYQTRHYGLLTGTAWPQQGGGQLIGAGHIDTTGSRVGMVYRQRAAPGEGIGFASLPWGKGEAGHCLAAATVDRITKQDGSAGAVRRDVNGSRIGDNNGGTAGQSLNGGRTYRHINTGDSECGC